jgi:hypothetical protein
MAQSGSPSGGGSSAPSSDSWTTIEAVLTLSDCFEVLHITVTFATTERDVIAAFRKLALLVHPDKAKHPRATEAFKKLSTAKDEACKTLKGGNRWSAGARHRSKSAQAAGRKPKPTADDAASGDGAAAASDESAGGSSPAPKAPDFGSKHNSRDCPGFKEAKEADGDGSWFNGRSRAGASDARSSSSTFAGGRGRGRAQGPFGGARRPTSENGIPTFRESETKGKFAVNIPTFTSGSSNKGYPTFRTPNAHEGWGPSTANEPVYPPFREPPPKPAPPKFTPFWQQSHSAAGATPAAADTTAAEAPFEAMPTFGMGKTRNV